MIGILMMIAARIPCKNVARSTQSVPCAAVVYAADAFDVLHALCASHAFYAGGRDRLANRTQPDLRQHGHLGLPRRNNRHVPPCTDQRTDTYHTKYSQHQGFLVHVLRLWMVNRSGLALEWLRLSNVERWLSRLHNRRNMAAG